MAQVFQESFQRLFTDTLNEGIEEKQLGEKYRWSEWWPLDSTPRGTVVEFFRATLTRGPEGETLGAPVEIPKGEDEAIARQEIKRQILARLTEA